MEAGTHHSSGLNELEFERVSFRYPDGVPALQDITFSMCRGEKLALVGPNGAGKSTLLLHINGILRGEGIIRVCGLAVNAENLKRVRALVGLVFQAPDDQLFSPTVFDDVAFGPLYQGFSKAEVEERVGQALSAVRMAGYAKRAPHHLSAGEKKRIAIATVLSMNPEIIVLDEPTAGLDPRARRGLIHLLRELPQTVIAASHDLAMVRELFPRTIVLDEGKIAADRETTAILEDKKLLEDHGLETI